MKPTLEVIAGTGVAAVGGYLGFTYAPEALLHISGFAKYFAAGGIAAGSAALWAGGSAFALKGFADWMRDVRKDRFAKEIASCYDLSECFAETLSKGSTFPPNKGDPDYAVVKADAALKSVAGKLVSYARR